MTSDEQLKLWVEGTSVHNKTRNECCPDFSCCKPEFLQPKEIRQAFVDAGPEDRTKMLMSFLGEALSKADFNKKVYIAGLESDD